MAGLLEKRYSVIMGNKTDTGNFVCNCSCSLHFPATEILSLDICRLW